MGGRIHLELHPFDCLKCAEPPMLREFWVDRFQWGMVANHSMNPMNFYFASTMDATQIAALPENVDGKNRLDAEQTLISNLYLCLGEKGQDKFPKQKLLLDLGASRYPRALDALEGEFKETYETFRPLSKKQQIGESLEQFHAVLSGDAARCSFGALEARVLRDLFIVIMTNRKAQNQLCRVTEPRKVSYRPFLREGRQICQNLRFDRRHSNEQYHMRRDANQDGAGGSYQRWIPEQPGERTWPNPRPRIVPRRYDRGRP